MRDREKHEIALEAYRKRVNDLEQWLGQTKQDQRGVGLPSETADTLKDQLKENEVGMSRQLAHPFINVENCRCVHSKYCVGQVHV